MRKKPLVLEGRQQNRPKPRLPGPQRTRKIAFLGSHHSIHYAPWDDPTWEMWSHASTRTLCKRLPERLFDVHPTWIRGTPKGEAYLDKIKAWPAPIYMAERYPEIPNAVRYPKELMLSLYQPAGENVFTSHAAWMAALALYEGVTHVGFWGISYGAGEERESQRESLIYWIGLLRGAGVQVHLPHTGKYKVAINTYPMELYGYESHDKEGKLVESYQPKTAQLETPKGPVTMTVVKGDPDKATFTRADIGEEPASSRAPWNWYPKWKKDLIERDTCQTKKNSKPPCKKPPKRKSKPSSRKTQTGGTGRTKASRKPSASSPSTSTRKGSQRQTKKRSTRATGKRRSFQR